MLDDDEILNDFVQESKEYLEDIENEFLEIEQNGQNIDEDLVNKVFRKLHTIKGGAGFVGLIKIKELSHELESILNLIRNREFIPNSENIDQMLSAIDVLRQMVFNPHDSEEVDITEPLARLKKLLDSNVAQDVVEVLEHTVEIESKNISSSDKSANSEIGINNFEVSQYDIENHLASGKEFFVFKVDLIEDCEKKNKTPLEFIEQCDALGELLDSIFSIEGIQNLDQSELGSVGNMPLICLLASHYSLESIAKELNISLDKIHQVNPILDMGDAIVENEQSQEVSQVETQLVNSNSEVEVAILEKSNEVLTQEIEVAPPNLESSEKPKEEKKKSKKADATVRINLNLLDQLMTLAGELVLGRNQMMQIVSERKDADLNLIGQKINAVTTELQGTIMQTRMQQIGDVFNRYPRVVRDLSKKLGKKIELSIEGNDVELDRTMIESLADPLTHIIRNSIDHGIELPNDRVKSGKVPEGSLLLKAYHESGLVHIVIKDDGKGIDKARIKQKAVEKKLITAEEALKMRDDEALSYIFHPGLSTAEKVSDISGRGVGMDVVKTNISQIGGSVEIQSDQGVGTTIVIKLPLTLAIIPSLVVRSGQERYAIPQVNIVELVRIKANDLSQKIEKIKESEVFRLRDKLLPLLRLSKVLNDGSCYYDPLAKDLKKNERSNIIDRRSKNSDEPSAEILEQRKGEQRRKSPLNTYEIIVLRAGEYEYGLIVDAVVNFEEIVVKPLGRHLKKYLCYSGATIMGNGEVALILDTVGIAEQSKLKTINIDELIKKNDTNKNYDKHEKVPFAFLSNGGNQQLAIPLSKVSRLDKINSQSIEEIMGKSTIQYFDQTMTLIELDQYINVPPVDKSQENLFVILLKIPNQCIGVLTQELRDIKEINTTMDVGTFKSKGVVGSTIIDGITTLFLDVYELIDLVDPSLSAPKDPIQSQKNKDETATILIAEDSDFFRAQIKKFLKDEGYHVLDYENGKLAFDGLIQNLSKVDLVMTDIEMPEMDGLELAAAIKKDARTQHLNVFTLTTLAGDDDRQKGVEAGVDEYMVKLDKDLVISKVREYLNRLGVS